MRPPVPDLTEVTSNLCVVVSASKKIDDLPFDQVHGPLYPTERRHEFPRDPPKRSACHRNHDKLAKWQDAVLV